MIKGGRTGGGERGGRVPCQPAATMVTTDGLVPQRKQVIDRGLSWHVFCPGGEGAGGGCPAPS